MVSNDEKMLKERIRHLLTFKRETIADWADNETLRVRYRRQVNGEASVPYSTLVLILERYHDISADWLVMGEGSMHKTVDRPQIFNQQHYEMQNGQNNSGTINFGDTVIPYPLQALLDEKDKRIAELEKDKTQLQGLLSVFTHQAEAVAPKKKMKNSDAD